MAAAAGYWLGDGGMSALGAPFLGGLSANVLQAPIAAVASLLSRRCRDGAGEDGGGQVCGTEAEEPVHSGRSRTGPAEGICMVDLPRELELAVGETWTAQLDVSGGGYRWHADVVGDDGIVEAATDYAEGEVKEGGWRGDAVTVRGARPGSVDVHLVQRRSWETSGGGGDGQSIRVTVRPA